MHHVMHSIILSKASLLRVEYESENDHVDQVLEEVYPLVVLVLSVTLVILLRF
jgi:hypothetical protein